jgi:small subunit ribosomal protein S21
MGAWRREPPLPHALMRLSPVHLLVDAAEPPCKNARLLPVETGFLRFLRFTPFSRDGGCNSLAEVKVQDGESIESALRRFKRKVQQEDIIKDIKKHSFYLKPGDKRRAKQALARKRSRKKQRRELD